MIRYLWFDLGYTLVRTNREAVYGQVLKQLGASRSMDEITLAYHQTDKLFMRQFQGVLGKNSRTFMPWYIGTLNYNLQLALPIDDVMQVQRSIVREQPLEWSAFEHTKPTLHQLRSLGYRIGLISNWDTSAREVLARNRLDEELDDIIISSEVGMEKPDPDIFRLALSRAGVTADQCLYVGDNYYDDVVGSRQIGMGCLLINPYGTCGIEELAHTPVISGIHEVVSCLGRPVMK
ncbi:HAD family hydrolase [Paenibacillus pinihumi]|uniref:HAD family hydrolase n=1 Tax=Paenibacillus pinihumi TaxID=669462 RepID=UPI0003FF01C0|nr:HAD family hydrolase [Paenibacillus pinihumi]